MSLDGQLEKLGALYAEKSDRELLDLHDRRDGLTDLAQQALAGVMGERGLSARGVSGESGSQPPPGEIRGDQTADALVENEMLAYLFHDAFEAREAIRNMTDAAIPYRMLDWHNVNPEMEVSYTGVDLGLVVPREDASRTMVVLKEKMGLFPEKENTPGNGSTGSGDEADAAEAMAVLSMFDRNEALAAAQALGEAGITYLWRDGRDNTADLPDEETVAIEVRSSNLEHATKLVEDALAALPDDAH